MSDDLRAAKDEYDAAIDHLLNSVASEDKDHVRALCLEVLKKTGPLEKAYRNAAKDEALEKAEAMQETANELVLKTLAFIQPVFSYLDRRPATQG